MLTYLFGSEHKKLRKASYVDERISLPTDES